jgi:hypothetical protein
MRRPAGSGFCVAMISRTLAIAVAVKIRGAFFSVSCVGATVVVAIVSPFGVIELTPSL